MSTPELCAYVRERTHEGVSFEALRDDLREAGWLDEDIDASFHAVASSLNPVTPGIAIHEDLAQVRGVVAHLASRLQQAEMTLAQLAVPSTAQPLLSQQDMITTTWRGPDHELPVGRPASSWKFAMGAIFVCVLSVASVTLGIGTIERGAIVLSDFSIVLGSLVSFLYIAALGTAFRGARSVSSLASMTATVMTVVYAYFLWSQFQVISGVVMVSIIAGILLLSWWIRRVGSRHQSV